MKLFRAQNPQVVDYLKDKLMPDRDTTKNVFAELLKEYMRSNPKECFVVTLWEGEEIKSFIISYIPYKRNHLFIAQVFMDNTLDSKWPKLMFSQLIAFAEKNGLEEIRGETTRNPEACLRKWGFETYSTILSYKTFDTNNVEDI